MKQQYIDLPENFEPARGQFLKLNEDFVQALSNELQGLKVLEVFSGNGLLAAHLRNRGVEVIATSRLSGHDAHEYGMYTQVEQIEALDSVLKYGHECDVLLMAWPVATNHAFHAAAAWHVNRKDEGRIAPIVFIGERTNYAKNHLGGCADDDFHEVFEEGKAIAGYRGNYMEIANVGRLNEDKLEAVLDRQIKRSRAFRP